MERKPEISDCSQGSGGKRNRASPRLCRTDSSSSTMLGEGAAAGRAPRAKKRFKKAGSPVLPKNMFKHVTARIEPPNRCMQEWWHELNDMRDATSTFLSFIDAWRTEGIVRRSLIDAFDEAAEEAGGSETED